MGQGRDGSRMSGLWMMGASTASGKTRKGVGREGELSFGADESEILRHPSGDVGWTVGYLSGVQELCQGWRCKAGGVSI